MEAGKKETKIGCFIFHRDLRINDNRGLKRFCDESGCDCVIPVFVFTPSQVDNDKNTYKSIHSVRFMIECLSDLNDALDGTLITFYGDLNEVLRELQKKIRFSAIGFNQDISPFSLKRTKGIKKLFNVDDEDKNTVSVLTYDDYYLCDFNNDALLNDGKPFVKFSAFERRAYDYLSNIKDKPYVLERTSNIKKKINSGITKTIHNDINKMSFYISLHDAYLKFVSPSHHKCCRGVNKHGFNMDAMSIWEGTRSNGVKILKRLEDGNFNTYDKRRDDLNYKTTRLSAFIKYGLVSVREVALAMTGRTKTGTLTFASMKNSSLFRQLLWREFYALILYHIPRVLTEPFQEKYASLKWDNNNKWTQSWKDGRTGYPIVDACMTEMNKTGYMHNRGRLIVSSFLVKLLLTDWRQGEHYFASMLVDYDPASNNGNWQWVAGTGTDSMPYFRIFNPWLQSEKHDKEGLYIKKWLPQLKEVKPKHLHQWDEHYNEYDLKNLNYLKPMVDYKERREKAIRVYKKV